MLLGLSDSVMHFITCNSTDHLAVQVDFMPVYAEHLRNIIKDGVNRTDNYDRPLEGFKVAVDPGNGAGGYFATDVLAPLGCDVSGDDCSCTEHTACVWNSVTIVALCILWSLE